MLLFEAIIFRFYQVNLEQILMYNIIRPDHGNKIAR